MEDNNPFAHFALKRGDARDSPRKRVKTERPAAVPAPVPPELAALKTEEPAAAPTVPPAVSKCIPTYLVTARPEMTMKHDKTAIIFPQPAIVHDGSTVMSAAHKTTTQTRLLEYSLIRHFRLVCKTSVDDFHLFLMSLRGETGRYWALVASILSVQCRDVVSLAVVRKIMAHAPNGPSDIAAMGQERLEQLCKRCNYYKTKAQKLVKITATVLAADGVVPESYEGLIALPGVGPKIAHLMRSVAFGHDETGIVVDCHVFRVSRLLGWVDVNRAKAAEQVRKQLEGWVPSGCWTDFTLDVVGFGQVTRMGAGWWTPFLNNVESRCGIDSDESIVAATMVARLNDAEKNAQALEAAG